MPRFENFVSGSYQSWSPNESTERCINMYPEVVEVQGGKSKAVLHGTPGLTLYCTLPTAPVRALWAGENRLFAAAGTKLYEITASGTPPWTDITLGSSIGDDAQHTPVGIYPNGHELLIVSAGNCYIHTGTSLVQPVMKTADGTVDTFANTVVLWKSGDKFSPAMMEPGTAFTVAGVPYTITAYQNPETMRLTVPGPVLTDAAYSSFTPLKARTGCYIDSYFVVNPPDSKVFYCSYPNDGIGVDGITGELLGWDGLEFGVKEAYPDNIAAVYADHQELYLFGTHWSIEAWRNEGDPNGPGGFRRDPGAFVHCACVAPWSICSLSSGLHFLGSDTRGGTVAYRLQGFQPVRVSNHATEQLWNKYAQVWDAFAYTYVEHGHQFWVLNFMTANATWVYDVASQQWHERGWWNGTSIEKHRARCHAYVRLAESEPPKHYVGDWQNGKVYIMSHEAFTDAGTAIHRVRQAPHLSNAQLEVFHHRLQVDIEVTGTAPSATLEWSNDDGDTWSAPKIRTPSMSGKRGRIIWNRNGMARDRIYRVTISDPVKVAIVDALIDVTPGVS